MRYHALALLLSGLFCGQIAGAQQGSPDWLFPSDKALEEGVQRGLNGAKPEFATVYKHGAFMGRGSMLGCRELTQEVLAVGPVGFAVLIGRNARSQFESSVDSAKILGFRGAVALRVSFFSKDDTTQMEAALAQGNLLFRPAEKQSIDVSQVGCKMGAAGLHVYTSEYTWQIQELLIFHFEEGKAQPDWNSPVKLILRRSDGREESFQFDLRHALSKAKSADGNSKSESWGSPSQITSTINSPQMQAGKIATQPESQEIKGQTASELGSQQVVVQQDSKLPGAQEKASQLSPSPVAKEEASGLNLVNELARMGILEITDVGPGVKIKSVRSEGPAAKVHLVAGDTITGLNGKSINSSVALARELANCASGSQVRVDYLRSAFGTEIKLKVDLVLAD